MSIERLRQKLLPQLQEALSTSASITDIEHNVLEIRHTMYPDRRFTIALTDLLNKVEAEPEGEGRLLRDVVQRARATVLSMAKEHQLTGNEGRVYPVLRHSSFSQQAPSGYRYITKEHTSESVIYYALDLDSTYILIDEGLLGEAGWSAEQLHGYALRNLTLLDSTPKTDKVGDNIFYFISRGDGYAASRVLNPKLLEWMERKVTGELGVAFPHQDVLIFADLKDAKGYQVLAQIAMDFATRGDVPISALPFIAEEGQLETFMAVQTKPTASKSAPRMMKPSPSRPKK